MNWQNILKSTKYRSSQNRKILRQYLKPQIIEGMASHFAGRKQISYQDMYDYLTPFTQGEKRKEVLDENLIYRPTAGRLLKEPSFLKIDLTNIVKYHLINEMGYEVRNVKRNGIQVRMYVLIEE